MMNNFIYLYLFIASLNLAYAMPILSRSNGVLTGIMDVVVDGGLYDVEFVEGTLASVYGNGIPPAFDFTSLASSISASQALADALAGEPEASDGTLIFGLETQFGIIMTPYELKSRESYNFIRVFTNGVPDVLSSPLEILNTIDTSTRFDLVLTDWTQTGIEPPQLPDPDPDPDPNSSVIEPESLTLLSLGLLSYMCGRKRKVN